MEAQSESRKINQNGILYQVASVSGTNIDSLVMDRPVERRVYRDLTSLRRSSRLESLAERSKEHGALKGRHPKEIIKEVNSSIRELKSIMDGYFLGRAALNLKIYTEGVMSSAEKLEEVLGNIDLSKEDLSNYIERANTHVEDIKNYVKKARSDQDIIHLRETLNALIDERYEKRLDKQINKVFGQLTSAGARSPKNYSSLVKKLRKLEGEKALYLTSKRIIVNPSVRRDMKSILYSTEFILQEEGAVRYKLKLDRAKQLEKVDKNLAAFYLGFTHNSSIRLEAGKEGVNKSVKEITKGWNEKDNIRSIGLFWERDDMLYKAIVDNLSLKKEAKKEKADSTIKHGRAEKIPKLEIVESTEEHLLRRILNGSRGDFPGDAALRAELFVNEDLDKWGVSEEDRDCLSYAFGHLKLHKVIRHEKPEAMKVRNFFDDIVIKYLSKGRMPDTKDLKAVYAAA